MFRQIYFGNNSRPNLTQIFVFLSEVKQPVAGIKVENVVVKTEVKTELVKSESPIRVHPVTGLPTKDDEYDSSATVSHKLRQSQRGLYMTQLHQALGRGGSERPKCTGCHLRMILFAIKYTRTSMY